MSKETQLKSRGGSEVYYIREWIDLLASVIITIMVVALLIVPIYLPYTSVSRSNSTLDRNGLAVRIGLLLVFTLLFSAVLSLFTRAKRHEILVQLPREYVDSWQLDLKLMPAQVLRRPRGLFG
jgi:hypothetical protein